MDYIKAINDLLKIDNRYNNFGELILGLSIQGVKGTNCNIRFDYPVTAISGFNGAGKSTIAQIALCAYQEDVNSEYQGRYYLKDFFMKTLLDKQPYDENAQIFVTYAIQKAKESAQLSMFKDDDNKKYEKQLKMYYAGDRWAGYRHQPKRCVFYYGMSYFIPYQEMSSNLLGDNKASVIKSQSFKQEIITKVANILSIDYNDLQHNNVRNDKREEQVISALKGTVTYSENHMGCGEGRLLKLVDAMENAPSKSLFVIEEPETALHQLAQHKLSQYFLDVCFRKKHQIIFTTHSSAILSSLPLTARKFIVRDKDVTKVLNNPTMMEVDNLLSGGQIKGLTIITEDSVAEIYLREVLRKFSQWLFDNCSIYGLGIGYPELKKYVENTRKCKFNICGVVDEYRRKETDKYIIAFPENLPPEQAFFKDDKLCAFIEREYKFDCKKLNNDFHSYFNQISRETNEDENYLKVRCIKEYVSYHDETYYSEMINLLTDFLKKETK